MQTFVILLRGINVGGHNKLPMKELVPLLKANQYQDISTYIQTGNIVLTAENNPEQDIKHMIASHFGFTPDVFVISVADFSLAVANNPYHEFDGKLVHLYFCQHIIELNMEKIKKWIGLTESYHIEQNILYLHAPDGIGRSKLVANIESCLNQTGTGRNLNTINKISIMLEDKQ